MKFHFVKKSMNVAIAVITVGFNVLIPTMALGQARAPSTVTVERPWPISINIRQAQKR